MAGSIRSKAMKSRMAQLEAVVRSGWLLSSHPTVASRTAHEQFRSWNELGKLPHANNKHFCSESFPQYRTEFMPRTSGSSSSHGEQTSGQQARHMASCPRPTPASKLPEGPSFTDFMRNVHLADASDASELASGAQGEGDERAHSQITETVVPYLLPDPDDGAAAAGRSSSVIDSVSGSVSGVEGREQKKPGVIYFETYGCQMNVNDLEIVFAILGKAGYTLRTDDPAEADVILINTCAIRENAERKIWHRLNFFKHLKQRWGKAEFARPPPKGPPRVAVLGCMAERLKTKLVDADKMVDVVCGPDAYRDLPRLLAQVDAGQTGVNTLLSLEETYADVSPVRIAADSVTAFVSVMRGCDNMCAYCIVPFTRGRERSRPLRSVAREVGELWTQGVREVVLLGQNVNSYRDTSSEAAAPAAAAAAAAAASAPDQAPVPAGGVGVEAEAAETSPTPSLSLSTSAGAAAAAKVVAAAEVAELVAQPRWIAAAPHAVDPSCPSHSGASDSGAASASTPVGNTSAGGDHLGSASSAAARPGALSAAAHLSSGFTTLYKSKQGGLRFAHLLDVLSASFPEMRFRFTSPHPKDFPDELLLLIRERPNLCCSIHLPAQSGSSRVLEAMRRGYSREAYLALVERVRAVLPDVAISSDFITGFCGETEEEHCETLSLIEAVGFDMAYMFAYSLREKTHAHRRYSDDVPEAVKRRRLAEMIATFRRTTAPRYEAQIGRRQLVLVQGPNRRAPDAELIGKNDAGHKVFLSNVPVADHLGAAAAAAAAEGHSCWAPGEDAEEDDEGAWTAAAATKHGEALGRCDAGTEAHAQVQGQTREEGAGTHGKHVARGGSSVRRVMLKAGDYAEVEIYGSSLASLKGHPIARTSLTAFHRQQQAGGQASRVHEEEGPEEALG
eukprot:jgi/Mesen1/3056/ME000018S02363